MDRTLEDNIVDGLFFCATLTRRRGGHTVFAQAEEETSDTSAEAVKPTGPRLFLGGSLQGERVPVSWMKMRSVVGLSVHSAFHW